jgi:DNA (cytosine-5)-methyltransferase 1
MPTRKQTIETATRLFDSALFPDGVATSRSAWAGIYQCLLWYEMLPHATPGHERLPHIIDANRLTKNQDKGPSIWQGGVPCPPFSIAGRQLGHEDERDLFPEAIRLVREAKPRAVLIENVPGFASERFSEYRHNLLRKFSRLGYRAEWRVLNACWFGVPQLRPRFVLVAFRDSFPESFVWPEPNGCAPPTVGDTLADLMSLGGWKGAAKWRRRACAIAPTLVGGSKKHGGPDLGPTRAKRQWATLGVDGMGLADEPPTQERPVNYTPRLTVRMTARLQGFADSWTFTGGKTSAYRQVGNRTASSDMPIFRVQRLRGSALRAMRWLLRFPLPLRLARKISLTPVVRVPSRRSLRPLAVRDASLLPGRLQRLRERAPKYGCALA